VGLLDWLGKGRPSEPVAAVEWQVHRAAGDLVVDDGRGASMRVPLSNARSVRVVPLTRGNHHRDGRGEWQVALSSAAGDVLVGKPLTDWRSARQLAQRVCEAAELPLDELTKQLFSRVGQFTPAREA
jgi:hypothetical protein